MSLAVFAADENRSLGRRVAEPPAAYRGEYQRDRDRIIHCTAFRRLMYKTQVFVNHEGDLYRTRLTHSIEVAQIGRTVALALELSEPLTEAICLAHDLGHTPFGHAGQDSLNACMRDYGGFEHNFQSLRVVDELETRYPDFDGLNLMFETREGILKHCSAKNARTLGALGERFLNRQQAGLEAQIADLADAIAYNNHDMDDGIRANLLSVDQLCEQAIFARHYRAVCDTYPELEGRRIVNEVIRRIAGEVVTDLIAQSRRNLQAASPNSIADVRAMKKPLIQLSDDCHAEHLALKRFLHEHLYTHEKKLEMTRRVQAMIEALFAVYMQDLTALPEEFAVAASRATNDAEQARVVADYIAGMTDRFAIQEHQRLSGATVASAI